MGWTQASQVSVLSIFQIIIFLLPSPILPGDLFRRWRKRVEGASNLREEREVWGKVIGPGWGVVL